MFGAREVFKNDIEARGVIFPKYEPEISVLDPIQPIFHEQISFFVIKSLPTSLALPQGLFSSKKTSESLARPPAAIFHEK